MSANLDLVRSICAAWECGDFSSAEWANPEIERVIVGGPEPGSWTGLAGMAQAVARSSTPGRTCEPRCTDTASSTVSGSSPFFGCSRVARRAVAAWGEVQSKGANLFRLRDGKVTRLVFYWDRERARADLVLASEGDAPS
jgi:ketosteroid isomerase-like protein